MTRNTHLYKTQYVKDKKKHDIYYRDLTSLEYTFLNNIKNIAVKNDMAGRIAIWETDPDIVPFGTRMIIGRDAISRIDNLLSSKQIFEITINEFRENIKKDDFLMAIKNILMCIPGQSFTDLLNLTITDLLELSCVCELIIGKPLFDTGNKKSGLLNPKTLPDDGKSLQEKMDALNSHLGPQR